MSKFKIRASDVRFSLSSRVIRGDEYQEIRAVIVLDKYKPTPKSRLWRYDVMYIIDRDALTGGHKRRTSWEILVGFTEEKLISRLGGRRGESIIVPDKLTTALEFGTTVEKVLQTMIDQKEFRRSLKRRLKYHREKVQTRPIEFAKREKDYATARKTIEEKALVRYKKYNKTKLKTGERRLAALEKLQTVTV